jgi:uncharacterized membrane protein
LSNITQTRLTPTNSRRVGGECEMIALAYTIWGRRMPIRSVLTWVIAAAALTWAIALPLAAFAASRSEAPAPVYAFALVVYGLARVVCHQLPERSFHLWSAPMPVCARCTGIYAGAALAALAGPARWIGGTTERVRTALALAAAPTAATFVFEWATGRMPPGWVRALTGALLGAVVARVVLSVSASGRRGSGAQRGSESLG